MPHQKQKSSGCRSLWSYTATRRWIWPMLRLYCRRNIRRETHLYVGQRFLRLSAPRQRAVRGRTLRRNVWEGYFEVRIVFPMRTSLRALALLGERAHWRGSPGYRNSNAHRPVGHVGRIDTGFWRSQQFSPGAESPSLIEEVGAGFRSAHHDPTFVLYHLSAALSRFRNSAM